MKHLDPMTLPFAPRVLVEASAGTGKTYTIATLYLRALLGIGCEPRTPKEILVVTFTRAATEELRERVRQRIVELQRQLDDLPAPWSEWIQDIEAARLRLEVARHWMDDASIHTIHGFCQKVLHEFSVESGQLFEWRYLEQQESLRLEAVQDFWRRHVVTLDEDGYWQLTQWWQDPDALYQSLKPLLNLADVKFEQKEKLKSESLESLLEKWFKHRQYWPQHKAALKPLLEESGYLGKGYLRYLNSRLAAMDAVFKRPIAALAKHRQKNSDFQKVQYLGYESVCKAAKHNTDFIQALDNNLGVSSLHLLHSLWENSSALADQLEVKRQEWLLKAFNAVTAQIAHIKSRRALTSADDLLVRLDRGLLGPQGQTLADRISRRYPLAMIDEFQDTDAIQYRIFSTIYAEREEPSLNALLMIGDPKQAIYKFRGADIFTYLKASQGVGEHRYTLTHNYRSEPEVISAVNHLFKQSARPFVFEGIDYHPVSAAKLEKDTLSSTALPGLQAKMGLGWIPLPENTFSTKNDAYTWISDQFAKWIESVVNDSASNRSGGDIAVLVRDRNEAAYIQKALRLRGLRSVFLRRDNLYQTQEAAQLYFWLDAMAHPNHETKVRAALATELMGLTPDALEALYLNERVWEQEWLKFRAYHRQWMKEGILSTLMHVLHERGLPAQWLKDPHQGERRLTNVLHLAEHLQIQTQQVQGLQGLLDQFATELQSDTQAADHQLLRLESDQNLIQVVTIHRSKGLEYPIVCLPFIWYANKAREPIYHSKEKGLVFDLAASDAAMQQAETERLAEDIRLLYVALTRAKTFTLAGFGALTRGSPGQSAVHYLLSSSKKIAESHSTDKPDLDRLKTLIEASESMQMLDSENVLCSTSEDSGHSANAVRSVSKTFSGKIQRNWVVSSYSALTRSLDVGHQRTRREEFSNTESVQPTTETALNFPKGARAGNALHALLEAALEDYSAVGIDLEKVEWLLQQHGFESVWAQPVLDWLQCILRFPISAPMDADPCQLDQLKPHQAVVEMEFYLALDELNARDFMALCQQYPLLSCDVPEVQFPTIQGMLKGFIDLVFEWGGRYYVLDYKSNFLGYQAEDYRGASLENAMASHRYDVQLLLYTLALHRYLEQRLPDYDYDQHMGGGHYLFLRGLPMAAGHFFARPTKALILSLDKALRAAPSVLGGH